MRVPRDTNQVTVDAGVKQSDGITPSPLTAGASNHLLNVSDGTTGTDQTGNKSARRDDNSVTTMMAVSNDGLGVPVLLYVDNSGFLLVKSN